MRNPGNGEKPAKSGASAGGPSGIGASGAAGGRRSHDKGTVDAGPAAAGGKDGEAADIDACASPDDGKTARKRKRRRRSRGSKRKLDGPAEDSRWPDGANADPLISAHRHGKSHKKKHRALQGRPLNGAGSPAMAAIDPAKAAAGWNLNPVGDRKSRENGETRPAGERSIRLANGSGFPAEVQQMPFYAALDLGTNNCRLLVAQPTRPGQFRVVDAFSRIVRLGEGLGGSGRLSGEAMDRAVDALRICASKLANRPIRNRRLIATEACRRAANGPEFLARVRAETGLDLEVVDRETEARLAVAGCASLVERNARSVVLFDIGGGSSEIAVIGFGSGRAGRPTNHIKAWTSLPVGVVTLSEQHGGREVTREIFAAMVRDVEGLLAAFDCPVSLTGHNGGSAAGFHLLGTSGTVTTLAGIHLDLPRYDRRRVDGLWLTNGDVDRMVDRLLSWNFDQRSANPCIGADRADLVLAGCAIMEAIRRRWPSERMRVADRGLREGLLTEMMAADGIWRRPRRRRSAWRRPWAGAP
ncbi:MAG TPA: Ppx/GppA phosphatase family protein [Pararhizobium sp.]|nr:Ppx/GppA phosphatase family protein [Pararhizobium sp.]